jgi:hypothetical protein
MKKSFLLYSFFLLSFSLSAQPYEEPVNPTEASIRRYLKSGSPDAIEGIYKSMAGAYYRLGIKKTSENKYVAIVLDMDPRLKKRWKTGDVKAYLESSTVPYLYSIRWIWNNKTTKETIGEYDNNGILRIDDLDGTVKYIKLYPTDTNSN